MLKSCIDCGMPCEGSRCPDHQLPARPRPNKQSRAARGYGVEWQKLSKQLRARQPWCEMCGTSGARLTVDHIVPQSLGGDNNLRNLRVLCVDCHNRFGATKRRPPLHG